MEELSSRLLQLSHGDELTGLPRTGAASSSPAAGSCNSPTRRHRGPGPLRRRGQRAGPQRPPGSPRRQCRAAGHRTAALSVAFGRNDVLARIGGTQFLVLALNLGASDWTQLTARIREHLSTPDTTEFIGAEVRVSFGWTTRQAGDPSSLEELVARSDWAMLEAKEAREAANRSGAPGRLRRPLPALLSPKCRSPERRRSGRP